MNKTTRTSAPKGIASVVEALTKSLQKERKALDQLVQEVKAQMEALREHRHEDLEAHQHAVTEAVHALETAQPARERQMRLLARLLGEDTTHPRLLDLACALEQRPPHAEMAQTIIDLRDEVREQALQARQHCESLDYALRYATQLGQEMLQAVSALNVPPPPSVYTASGQTDASASSRSLLDRRG